MTPGLALPSAMSVPPDGTATTVRSRDRLARRAFIVRWSDAVASFSHTVGLVVAPPLPLPDLCVAALRLRRQQQEADRDSAGDAWIDTGLVFTTRHGTPIEP